VAFETKNLGRAAEILMVTREAIRKSIKELGNQLGFELFIPHSRGIEPTDKAKEIYPKIKSAIESLASLETPANPNAIRIAVSNASVEVIIVAYFKVFHAQHPNIQIQLLKREGMKLEDQKNLDFIVDADHMIDKNEFKTIEIISGAGDFVACKEFIKKNNIQNPTTKDEILKFPIISREEIWKEFQSCNKIKTKPHFINVASIDMAFPLTEDSFGIGHFAAELLLKIKPNSNLVILNVTDIVKTYVTYSCGYKNPLSPPARAFIDGLIKFCKV